MKPIEEIRAAFHRIHRVATGQSTEAFMSIPARPEHDADLIVSAALDELEELRGEVANACMALSGSTSWATDGSNLKALCEGAMLLRHDRDETAKALARAQELQRGAEAQHCAALARVEELEGHLAQWQAIARENAEEVRAAKKKGEEAAFHLEMYAKALRELVRVVSHQLARGEDPEEGAFDRAWVAACAALRERVRGEGG